MAISERTIALDRIRTDGWFERLGESIGSFHTLCDVLGERFFAFALIAGARVSSLMIDRFNPDQSLVEFSLGGMDDEQEMAEDATQRLTVTEFRERLVSILLTEEPAGPAAHELGEDLEALQRHIGPRALLLAPLYGYGLRELQANERGATLVVERRGQAERYAIPAFRERLREHIQDELKRGVQRQTTGTAIDLNHVDVAERAAAATDWAKVVSLLGSWPMPLAIYWRTPEGQMLPEQARQRIAEGLGLLGTACGKLGDHAQGEEVLRLAVQYAQDGSAAPAIFARLGEMFLAGERYGEAIGPLRRAKALGGSAKDLLPGLAKAFCERQRFVAALACMRDAERLGASRESLQELRAQLEAQLGDKLDRWQKLVTS